MKIATWFMALRPKTISAAIVPVVTSSALVTALGMHIDTVVIVCALISSIFIQLGTNLFNDALDFKKGTDTAERIGPKRATQSGLLTARQVMIGGAICFLLAAAFGISLVLKGGLVVLAVGIISLTAGYAYTGGPYPLAYVGLADLFVIIFFGLVAVGGVFYLHTHRYLPEALVVGLQVGLLATTLLAVNNLRDVETDRTANKRTLPVRFGVSFGRMEITLTALLPFIFDLVWLGHGWLWAAFLPFGALPVAVMVIRGIWTHEPSPIYNKYLGLSALLQMLFGVLLAVGFVRE